MPDVTVQVKCANSKKYSVTVDSGGSVPDLKAVICTAAQIPASEQRLIHKGKVLKDEQTLSFYEIGSDSTIYLVRSMTSNSSGAPPAPATSAPLGTAPFTLPSVPGTGALPGLGTQPFAAVFGQQPGQQQQQVPGQQGGPFGGFPGIDMGLGMGMPFQPSPEQMGQMQAQLMQNPEMMRSILQSPMMQSMMSNPEVMRNMLMNNPQMRQLLDANPQLNHVLNDPSLMRQAMEYMSNPAAMREAMRSNDLAMSQIENHPEGFNALRRMYTDIQEPMMQATADALTGGNQQSGQQSGSNNISSNSSSSSDSNTPGQRPNTAALPNPWASAGQGQGVGGAQQQQATGLPSGMPMSGAGPDMSSMANLMTQMGLGQQGGIGGNSQPGQQSQGGQTGQGQQQQQAMESAPLNPFIGGVGQGQQLEQGLAAMQDPMMRTMIQSMLANPQFLDQVANANPALRQMLDSQPGMRQMMSDPAVIQQMTNPNTMRSIMQLQQAGFLPQTNRFLQNPQPGGGTNFAGFPGMPPQPPLGLDFSSLLQNPQPPVVPGNSAVSTVDPAIRFATQLQQLEEMGFTDRTRNIQALQATAGNVQAAVERLLLP